MRLLNIVMISRGLKQDIIAQEAGIAASTFSDILNERSGPAPETALRIARALKMDVDTLFTPVNEAEILELVEHRKRLEAAGWPPMDGAARGRPVGSGKRQMAAHGPATEDSSAPIHPLTAVPDPYELAIANGLIPIRNDIYMEAPGLNGIPIWDERVAATSWASNDPTGDVEIAWVPEELWKFHGAQLRAIIVAGRSMERAGINPGNVVFVRQSSDPKRCDGEIVIAAGHDGMTLKRLRGNVLVAETNLDIRPIPLGRDAKLKGVVVAVHKPQRGAH